MLPQVVWDASTARAFQSHWLGLWKRSLSRAVKSTTTASGTYKLLRGRQNKQGKQHGVHVLGVTPPGDAAVEDWQKQGTVLRELFGMTLYGHWCVPSSVEKLRVKLSFVSTQHCVGVCPTVWCWSCLWQWLLVDAREEYRNWASIGQLSCKLVHRFRGQRWWFSVFDPWWTFLSTDTLPHPTHPPCLQCPVAAS